MHNGEQAANLKSLGLSPTTLDSTFQINLNLVFASQVYAVEGALTDAALLALRCVICAGGEDDEHLLLCDGRC